MKNLLLLLPFILLACNADKSSPLPAEENRIQAEAEIRQAEADFAAMAESEGVPAAFLHFAADEAVMQRGNRLIEGRAAMHDYFDAQTLDSVSLNWAPDFVKASAAGDLGYTYGRYTFRAVDTTGQEVKAEGIFHTVWQRQPDGTWRFVWD